MRSYLEPTQETGRMLMQRAFEGPVVMLNLLRFRKVADYSAHPELAPSAPISGAAAYDRYIAHTLPFLPASGGEMLFLGAGGRYLIGPEDESCACEDAHAAEAIQDALSAWTTCPDQSKTALTDSSRCFQSNEMFFRIEAAEASKRLRRLFLRLT
ncbi:hypothetical protein ACOBR2_09730 [Telmatobacter bradus]|uniref:hypothetical protein n=1 Tax=Telmatobacter bradus TaxID=474953 RepID=UPI003B431CFE